MNVVSLFDGISAGQVALERVGIKVNNYFASEIDKYCIQQTQINYPNTIQLGCVTEVDVSKLPKIDLLIGGSPCQGFSTAGKGLNFDDPRSKLFFEFVRTLNELREINPAIKFLLENVKMKQEWQDIISDLLCVRPIEINSALVSAQNRKRLYWTNIKSVDQPEDRGIILKDILEDEVDEKYYLSEKALARIVRGKYSKPKINPDKTGTLNTKNNSGQLSLDSGTTLIGVLNDHGELREKSEKSNCIDANYFKGMDNHAQRTMVLEINEATKKGYTEINPGEGFDFQHPGSTTRRGRKITNKTHTLQTASFTALFNGDKIRRLTPLECERLQTFPDNFTKDISETQRYKALGNSWTVDVIAHIFKNLKN